MSTGIQTKPPPGVFVDPTHPLSRGLVGWWLFNEGAGSRLSDISGLGNHGTLTDMDPATDWVGSLHGGALDFDGTDDFVSVGNDRSLNDLPALTVSAWVNLRADGNLESVVSKAATGGTGARDLLGQSTVNRLRFAIDRSAGDLEVRSTVGDGYVLAEWHHYAVAWDGTFTATNVRMYRDGVELGHSLDTDGSGDAVSDAALPLNIGSLRTNSFRLDGQIDDVRIYNRALSVDEVRQLFEDPYANLITVPIRRYLSAVALQTILLTETIAVADGLTRRGRKLTTDSVGVADSLTKRGSKLLAEPVGVSDTLIRRGLKLLTESITVADVLATAKTTAQLLAETINLVDALGLQAGKLLTEGVSVSDVVTKEASTTRSESPSFADSLTKRGRKLLTEGITFADVLNVRKVITILLAETIAFVDDLTNRARNLLTEGVSLSDVVEKGVSTTRSESPSFADSLTKRGRKLLTEGISFADVLNVRKVITILLSETIAVLDDLTNRARKLLTEGVGVSDAVTKSASTTRSESLTVSDSLVKLVGKLLVEAITFVDVVIRVFIAGGASFPILLTETIGVADSLTKRARKLLAEPLALSDAVTKFVSKLLVEGISIVDLLTTIPAAQAVPLLLLTFSLQTERIIAQAISGVRIEPQSR